MTKKELQYIDVQDILNTIKKSTSIEDLDILRQKHNKCEHLYGLDCISENCCYELEVLINDKVFSIVKEELNRCNSILEIKKIWGKFKLYVEYAPFPKGLYFDLINYSNIKEMEVKDE